MTDFQRGFEFCKEILTLRRMLLHGTIDRTSKQDEQILCDNATVLIDSKGVISWINNDKYEF